MEKIKVIIEIRGGNLVAVYANQPLQYVVVDFDNLDAGSDPIGPIRQPDIITQDLHCVYGGNPAGDEVSAKLKRIHF